ncbi:hypothetical protein GCM10023074_57640 [Microbispora amethystogenes]|uniref:Uncharacterized protein n=2 Tax=Microbispora amethystogenes TaxID=1427754 RepID=A0ABQ4FI48_9ACTN|nr:hypothetical protein Mam01_46440 [Microbispora amethystogenes]
MTAGTSEKVVAVLLRVLCALGIHLVFSLLFFAVAPGPAVVIVVIWIFPALYALAVVVICAVRRRLNSSIAWILWPAFWLCLNMAITQW